MKKFYIGADIGTNSVGVACTDESYRLIRAKSKDCWAVRLFDEGETAFDRRTKRTARRRLARRKQRINWLQELFEPFIDDKTFFIRLNNSQYLPEDKDSLLCGNKNNLFENEGEESKFYKKYPTIYHLRKALMDGGNFDIRLYYLALHHIIKYRGHFLYEGSIEDIRDFSNLMKGLDCAIADSYDGGLNLFDSVDSAKVRDILIDKKSGLRDKQVELEKLLCAKSKREKEILKGITGQKISPYVLFGDEFKEQKSFSLNDMSDEEFESKRSSYGESFTLLDLMHSVCNYVKFEKIFEGHSDISSAMISVYEKHKADLVLLKKVVRKQSKEDYNKIFRSVNEEKNYVNYIGYTSKDGRKIKVKKCKDEDFFKYLKKYLNGILNEDNFDIVSKIIKEIDDRIFLPKILHSDNGLFPKQVNEFELKKIIENMVRNYAETEEMASAVLSLFNYKIPYYVGPLTGCNSWVVRTDEKVTPWNFDRVVDLAKSNEAFMRRMTNKCAYIKGEDVLPKASIIYQKYDTLNQLNKLRINDRVISIELKQTIYNELFLKYPKVTDKKIKELLVREGLCSSSETKDITISGKDGDFKSSMSSYIRLKNILGDFVDDDLKSGGKVCENIILWHTLNTDKKIVEDLIEKNYGFIPEIKANIKQLKGLTFNDFGRLSAKLLIGIEGVDKTTGQILTIMDVLYQTNQNLNEVLNNESYNFSEIIDEENGIETEIISYETVEELYVSPAVRRGIWQTLLMIDEYVNAVGRQPDKIFIEVTRNDGKKGDNGRTQPRKRQLQEKFKNIGSAYSDIIEELSEEKYTDLKLRQERLYLYFRQLGRCMYTGERIILDELNGNRYDVDHILPRTYVKDDSLDNKVLVCRGANATKADTYPLPTEFSRKEVRAHWKMLLDKDLISKTTYDRLTRIEPLKDDDYNDFINRQKTITDQTAKAVIELLKRKYPNAKLIFSRAKNVNDFKNRFNLFKCRETNDLHHARDAYLNVVVGNVFDSVFSTPLGQSRKDGDVWRIYNLKKLFTRDVIGVWSKDSIKIVKDTYSKPSMSVTRYATCNKGKFYDETVCRKNDSAITAPRKGKGPLSDVTKYGGYTTQKTAYFAIVTSVDKKGKSIKTIEAIPVLVTYKLKTDTNAIQKYLESYLREPIIVIPKVKVKQLVSYNGSLCYLAGTTDNRITVHNASQLYTDNTTDEYVNELIKIIGMSDNGIITGNESQYITKTNKDGVIRIVVNKENNEKLYETLKNKLDSKIYKGLSAFASFKTNMERGKDKFCELSVLEQAKVLLQILKVFRCNAEISDIQAIGGTAHSGKKLFAKNITDVDFKLVNLSPAGLTVRIRKV